MSDEEGDLVVSLDPDEEVEKAVIRSEESEDLEWVTSVAIGLILVGSLLGLWFGILLFAADPQDVLDSSLFTSDDKEMVSGQIISALDEVNQTGGEPVEGVRVVILDIDGVATSHEAFTDRDGRFRMDSVPRDSLILEVIHSGNQTLRITFSPGDQADLTLTLTPGEGLVEEDLRRDSHLAEAVLLATVIASLTIISALLGFIGAAEIKRGQRYRRTQYLCGLALFSRGGIFIGPLLILVGMGMLASTKHQFADIEADEDQR
jgi:hypothetical protein